MTDDKVARNLNLVTNLRFFWVVKGNNEPRNWKIKNGLRWRV